MTASADDLAGLAGRIAKHLAATDDGCAARLLADHIATSWGPRMKAALLAIDPSRLDPGVARAVQMLRTCAPPDGASMDEIGPAMSNGGA